MANTFKVITRDVMSATANTDETLYTTQSGSTVVIIGLTLANVHTAQVTATVKLTSTIPLPVGSTVEIMAGNKIILNAGDIIKVACSVADKVSVIMSYMEIT